ncbi:DNA repair protein RadA [Candidatus Ishikawella capsulata]|uniref:DNA repair protein RadA n=1 Tax=Candidatus Ishikawaella capsulata Mpkobe TaxID=476281 RepID=C5WCV4_9ENTR|nr:DNA repair protein RadA [Candidatus Ishikawaella capsulata]BAH83160.1 predicted repair protein [Candidatus Ishikawaella capsulata Mpkobe]
MNNIHKYTFFCNKCSTSYLRWQGRCNNCQSWNSIHKESENYLFLNSKKYYGYEWISSDNNIQQLSDINIDNLSRYSTGFLEFDRVLGGGIVPGSTILVGGNPGIGKSTLLLQTIYMLSKNKKTLYVTGEESLQQIAIRAHRLNLKTKNMQLLAETNVEKICFLANKEDPQIIVIDSIQVMYSTEVSSSPGSVVQIRETAAYLTRFAKNYNIAIIMVGHVTKDGSLAGPKVLEHCIDCSLILEKSNKSYFCIMRSNKNRFGAVNEIGIFSMTDQGINEVNNPSAIFLSHTQEITSGSSIMVLWEGTRPLLVEIQVLVDYSTLNNARRIIVGIEQNRLAMLLAILHRHGGLQVTDHDIFINVVGGIKITETSADLCILLAIASSLHNYPIPQDIVIFGELGLNGEIRPVLNSDERIYEAVKHGFKRAIIPIANKPQKTIPEIKIFSVRKLIEAINIIKNF